MNSLGKTFSIGFCTTLIITSVGEHFHEARVGANGIEPRPVASRDETHREDRAFVTLAPRHAMTIATTMAAGNAWGSLDVKDPTGRPVRYKIGLG